MLDPNQEMLFMRGHYTKRITSRKRHPYLSSLSSGEKFQSVHQLCNTHLFRSVLDSTCLSIIVGMHSTCIPPVGILPMPCRNNGRRLLSHGMQACHERLGSPRPTQSCPHRTGITVTTTLCSPPSLPSPPELQS